MPQSSLLLIGRNDLTYTGYIPFRQRLQTYIISHNASILSHPFNGTVDQMFPLPQYLLLFRGLLPLDFQEMLKLLRVCVLSHDLPDHGQAKPHILQHLNTLCVQKLGFFIVPVSGKRIHLSRL